MAKGKYANSRHLNVKPLAVLLAVALLVGTAVGGTLAWLTDQTNEVKNTFTVGNIAIALNETEDDFRMVPGHTIDKDPKVTVKAGSEKSWVFVDVDKDHNLDHYITYAMASGWTQLTKDVKGNDITDQLIFYREQSGTETDVTYSVLDGDKVQVKESVTKADMNALLKMDEKGDVVMQDGKPVYDTDKLPTLTFKAYAVQYFKTNGTAFEPAEAWATAKSAVNS